MGNTHGVPRKSLHSHTFQQKGMEMKKQLAERLHSHMLNSLPLFILICIVIQINFMCHLSRLVHYQMLFLVWQI